MVGSHPDIIVSRRNSRGPLPSLCCMNMFEIFGFLAACSCCWCLSLAQMLFEILGLWKYGWLHFYGRLANHVSSPTHRPSSHLRVGCTCLFGAAALVAPCSSTGLAHPNAQALPGGWVRGNENCGKLTPRHHCEQAQFLRPSPILDSK